MTRLLLVIRGQVQGVGFRYFMRREALALGINGQVRNLADGAVKVTAEGSVAELKQLKARAAAGPGTARVAAVEEEWSEGPPQFVTFEITR